MKVLGIDPGLNGAFVVTDGKEFIKAFDMPVVAENGQKLIPYKPVFDLIWGLCYAHARGLPLHVFLEKPVSFGMGTKSAFNYGRGFEVVLIALTQNKMPFTLIEPSRWAKEMHGGTSKNMKPKVRSLKAAQKLYPQLVRALPKRARGGHHDGYIDALLIAGYGLRQLRGGDNFY